MSFIANSFTPIDDRILVQPGPEYKVKTVQTELEPKKYMKPTKDGAIPSKPVQKEVELVSELRVGKVLSIGNSTNPNVVIPFEVGDWVVYNVKQALMFGLLYKGDDKNCPVLLNRFQILTKVDENSVNEFINKVNEDSKEESKEGTPESNK
jgi:hypothetical protein